MFVLQAAVVKGRGGIATAVAHYERMLRAVGVRSAVLFSGPSREALRAGGVDVIDAPPLLTSPFAGALPLLDGLGRAIGARAGGEDMLVIVHSDRTLPALRRLLAGARFVTPCHSDKFKHKKSADLVVTLNPAQHALARAALPGVRIAQLGNPYVAAASAPAPARAEADTPLRFNFVARFIPTKDPSILLQAAQLARIEPAPAFRFIGAGPLEGELKTAAQQSRVSASFPGWAAAPFADFHGRDVLVLPSRWEGLPYLLLEALDHGVPIIASDIAGNRTALGDGAYGALFRLGDAAALARAIEAVAADLDAARAKAEHGKAAIHGRYGAGPFWRALLDEIRAPSAAD